MQLKKTHALGIAAIVLATSAVIYISRRPIKSLTESKQGEPLQSVEQVLAERAKQANKHLDSPLGKAIANRNWVEAQKVYQPALVFHELAEIIRALFIDNKMSEFTADDQEKLLALVIESFTVMPEKNYHQTGLLVSQFERLPSPNHESENFKTLLKWSKASKENPLMRRMGITKLVIQDANPDESALSFFKKLIVGGDTYGVTRSDWIQKIDDMRNPKIKLECVELIAKNIKGIPSDSQAAALVVLAHHLDVKSLATKNMTLRFLKSEDQSKFEAALRALPPILAANLLKESDKTDIVKKLTNLPLSLKTPYVEMKSSELLKLLGHT